MSGTDYVGFVDVGFLKAEGARLLGVKPALVRPDAPAVVEWFKGLDCGAVDGARFVRAYWYDGAFDPGHREYQGQRQFFNHIASTPGVQLRLGHIAERAPRLEKPILGAIRAAGASVGVDSDQLLAEFRKRWTFYPERQQKGVDTLVALDLVRLASRGNLGTAVLLAGDRDLAEAVRAAQDFGQRVVVATPLRQSLARELEQLADEVLDLDEAVVRAMLKFRTVPAA